MPTQLMWFRRDLRAVDHPALSAAGDSTESGDALLCLFVLDPTLLASSRISPARVRYLRHALVDLNRRLERLGNALVVLDGDPRTVVPAVATRVQATPVKRPTRSSRRSTAPGASGSMARRWMPRTLSPNPSATSRERTLPTIGCWRSRPQLSRGPMAARRPLASDWTNG
ncbi:MAG: deoxyribodipyrimidine photo-lyase [Euzebya sp.]